MKYILIIFCALLTFSVIAFTFSERVLEFFEGDRAQAAKFMVALASVTGGWFGASIFILAKPYALSAIALQEEMVRSLGSGESLQPALSLFGRLHSAFRFFLNYNVPAVFFLAGTHIFAILCWFGFVHIDLKNAKGQDESIAKKLKYESSVGQEAGVKKEFVAEDHEFKMKKLAEEALERYKQHNDYELYEKEINEITQQFKNSVKNKTNTN